MFIKWYILLVKNYNFDDLSIRLSLHSISMCVQYLTVVKKDTLFILFNHYFLFYIKTDEKSIIFVPIIIFVFNTNWPDKNILFQIQKIRCAIFSRIIFKKFYTLVHLKKYD
jgi:hypothetical protein